jgi:hypothetical protein
MVPMLVAVARRNGVSLISAGRHISTVACGSKIRAQRTLSQRGSSALKSA